MPYLEAMAFATHDADRRLAAAIDELARLHDVPVPEPPELIAGTYPRASRVDRTLMLAMQVEAVLDRLRRPVAE